MSKTWPFALVVAGKFPRWCAMYDKIALQSKDGARQGRADIRQGKISKHEDVVVRVPDEIARSGQARKCRFDGERIEQWQLRRDGSVQELRMMTKH